MDSSTLYIHAIYFAMNTISHVAIGDLTSVTTTERALNAFLILLLTFFYAFLFANISSLFVEDNNFLAFHHRYQYVLNSIPPDQLTPAVVKKVNAYYEHLWSVSQGHDEQTEIFGQALPAQIRYDALRERY